MKKDIYRIAFVLYDEDARVAEAFKQANPKTAHNEIYMAGLRKKKEEK